MKLNELFSIERGVRLTKANQQPGETPLVTAGSTNDGIKAKISNGLSSLYQNVITIDMFGFVKFRPYPFFCDDNIIVLVPKADITLTPMEMVYYSLVLKEQAKDRYSYGRQCRLKNIDVFEVPSKEEIPEWVYTMEIPTYDDISDSNTNEKVKLPPISEWKSFKYEDLFDMKRGQGPSATEAKHNPGNVPYVGSSAENNGVTSYTSLPASEIENTITIANNGSVGETFYHNTPYSASSDVTVLSIKNKIMTPAIAMFLVTLIKQEQYKFNYGRKWGITRMKESIIRLPVNNNDEPDWDLMERYINSLPYSKYL